MSQALTRFQGLLRELFQFDCADLDFGLYRIMNHKRSIVERFIDNDLPQTVRKALEKGALKDQSDDKAALDELAKRIRKDINDDAISPDGHLAPEHANTNLGKQYLKLQATLGSAQGFESIETEIYNRLYEFFSRYYDDGDFITLRRYGSRSHYAIPYNGEEVVLHWANRDQYYIKTEEQFRDYRFRTNEGNDAWTGEFKLRAAEMETGNKKAQARRFFLFNVADAAVDERGKSLSIPVEYRALGIEEEKSFGPRQQQEKINAQTEEKLLRIRRVQAEAALVAALSRNVSSDESKPRSLVAVHLTRFTRRNTSDYFIHKDLHGFLTRELDFYLKAEAIDLDSLLRSGAPAAEGWLQKLACLREVGERIIQFLSRLEDFEKKLFEKRKFITECHWCLTLDHVERAGLTEELAKILNSTAGGKAQLGEWKRLFASEAIKGWKNKVSADLLRKNPFLVLDTIHMPVAFSSRLISAIDGLDSKTGGVLINADNFHGLAILLERYRKSLECIYIDPPYNTGDSEIPYKNTYQKSCWLTLIENRLSIAQHLLSDDPALFIAIDDFEMSDLVKLIDSRFGDLRREMIIVNHHPQGGKAKTLAHTHEYMLACVRRESSRTFVGRTASDGIERRPFKRSGTAESNFRYGRPNSFYAVLVDPKTKAVVGLEPPPERDGKYPNKPTEDGFIRVYPIGANDDERVWRRSYESALDLVAPVLGWIDNLPSDRCWRPQISTVFELDRPAVQRRHIWGQSSSRHSR
jgi:adenine-specific DNA-methyltransferase